MWKFKGFRCKKIGQMSYFYKLKFCISGNPDGGVIFLGFWKSLGRVGFTLPVALFTKKYIPAPINPITSSIINIVDNIFQPDFGALPVTLPEYPFT
jgi:hypothetical protein